jgi:transcriptional regulator with XRE-family HTH domain
MSQFNSHREFLIETFKADPEARYAYAEDFLNTVIASQIYVLREQQGMTQAELAAAIGTKQSGISRLENVNYSAWKTQTLKKIARALGVRLRVTFETFGTLLDEDDSFSKKSLQRDRFEDDPTFHDTAASTNNASMNNVVLLTEWTSKSGNITAEASTPIEPTPGVSSQGPQQPTPFVATEFKLAS